MCLCSLEVAVLEGWRRLPRSFEGRAALEATAPGGRRRRPRGGSSTAELVLGGSKNGDVLTPSRRPPFPFPPQPGSGGGAPSPATCAGAGGGREAKDLLSPSRRPRWSLLRRVRLDARKPSRSRACRRAWNLPDLHLRDPRFERERGTRCPQLARRHCPPLARRGRRRGADGLGTEELGLGGGAGGGGAGGGGACGGAAEEAETSGARKRLGWGKAQPPPRMHLSGGLAAKHNTCCSTCWS
jgi:hypothetical protein